MSYHLSQGRDGPLNQKATICCVFSKYTTLCVIRILQTRPHSTTQEVGPFMPIIQVRKLRLPVMIRFAQGHAATKVQERFDSSPA